MTKHNIWSISITGLLFALLFTPLIVSSSLYFPYITGKFFAFRIIITITLILWGILILKNQEFLPKKSYIIFVTGIFLLWVAISNFFGVEVKNSFFSNYERMEGWFTHLYLFVYLVILSSVLQTEKIWNWFLGTSVLVGNIVALSAVFDRESRTQIILGNSTYVAIYMLLNFFFVALLIYKLYKKRIEDIVIKYAGFVYLVSSMILFVYVIFKTQTRGTILALIFSTMLFFILCAISYWKNKVVRMVTLSLFILSVAGSVLFWQNRGASFIQNNPSLLRIATISANEGTGKARLINWGIAFEGIKEKPVFGWGQENYTYVFAQKYDPHMYAQEPWFDRTHNAFIDWAVQNGIPALILYLLIFVSAVYVIKKSTSLARVEKNLLIALLMGYIIHNIFVFDNYSSYLLFFTVLAFIVFHSQKPKFEINCDEKTKQLSLMVIALLFIILSVFTIIKPMIVGNDLIDALSQKDGNEIMKIYKSIFDKNTFGSTEASIRYLADVNLFLQVDNVEFKNKYIESARKVGEDLTKNSNDVRKLETYGTFLLQIGDVKKAIEVLEKAQKLAPNRHNNLYTLGIAYMNIGEKEKGKEVFKHAYEILPENMKAKTYYGAVLLMIGDKSGQELIKDYSYQDPFFLNVFANLKQYKEVIKIREQMKKDDPTDYQNQVSLAVAYSLDGQKLKAIQIITEVQKAIPEFKGQGDYLIKEIQAGRKISK